MEMEMVLEMEIRERDRDKERDREIEIEMKKKIKVKDKMKMKMKREERGERREERERGERREKRGERREERGERREERGERRERLRRKKQRKDEFKEDLILLKTYLKTQKPARRIISHPVGLIICSKFPNPGRFFNCGLDSDSDLRPPRIFSELRFDNKLPHGIRPLCFREKVRALHLSLLRCSGVSCQHHAVMNTRKTRCK